MRSPPVSRSRRNFLSARTNPTSFFAFSTLFTPRVLKVAKPPVALDQLPKVGLVQVGPHFARVNIEIRPIHILKRIDALGPPSEPTAR